MPSRYLHIFVFRWKEAATADDRSVAERQIIAFLGPIPGLLTVRAGENLAENNGGYKFGGCMEFVDAAAYRAYCEHPLHTALLEWLVPLVDAVEFDLPAE
jgi:hypothetical protein